MGHALRRAACRTGEDTCAGCPHLHACDYSLAFESPRPLGDTQLNTDTVPRPFGLLAAGTALGEQEVTLALYGSGVRFLGPLTAALRAAGGGGIGPDRARWQMTNASCEQPLGSGVWCPWTQAAHREPAPAQWPAAPKRALVRIETPLRLRDRQGYVNPSRFQLAHLFNNLITRLQLLCHYYGTPIAADFRALGALAATAAITQSGLRWHELTRYSSRQQRAVQSDGLVGQFEAAVPEELWPYLWLGQFVQAGKGVVMGLGQYSVQEVPCGN
ncbi:MAG TPA: CRISPR system precrRNA processing endoribonuclease RAMP protein Cas6 [Terriglobales bacterium]|nr:CRISPR system precrRNA processing endoribonuclease RAMP protein Cas6 [Terriglobales bacterium]